LITFEKRLNHPGSAAVRGPQSPGPRRDTDAKLEIEAADRAALEVFGYVEPGAPSLAEGAGG